MIKFLHCADLHLDSPLSALDLQKAEVRRNEMRASFTSITLYAATNKLDFLLISGDLFNSDYVTKDTVALITSEFAKIPDCKVIIAPGNHDPYTKQSCYRRADFPDNVYIFDSNELSCFDFPDKNTTIYGWAFTEPSLVPPSTLPPKIPTESISSPYTPTTAHRSRHTVRCPKTSRQTAASTTSRSVTFINSAESISSVVHITHIPAASRDAASTSAVRKA